MLATLVDRTLATPVEFAQIISYSM